MPTDRRAEARAALSKSDLPGLFTHPTPPTLREQLQALLDKHGATAVNCGGTLYTVDQIYGDGCGAARDEAHRRLPGRG